MNDFVLTLLGSYCFPIVMSLILAYLIYGMNKSHKEDSEKWRNSIDNNTAVLEKILDKLN